MGYKIYCYITFYGYANFSIAFKLNFGGGLPQGKKARMPGLDD